MTNNKTPQFPSLSDTEILLRHQLNVVYYWQSKTQDSVYERDDKPKDELGHSPSEWLLLKDIQLHSWQIECKEKWFASNKQGVVKVVTGAGKTILALSIIQDIQNKLDPEVNVVIVVPTIVLMNQWYEAFINHSNLPPRIIGRLGGGFKDNFADGKRVLICVLASASKSLPRDIKVSGKGEHLFLIVDECHKAGAEKMSSIFNVDRKYSLGLSATPEREDVPDAPDEESEAINAELEKEEKFEDTLLGQELGPIIYELTFNDAIQQGIMPKFEIRHYGLPLVDDEPSQYDRLSREITELRKELQRSSKSAGSLGGGALVGWARKVASRQKSKLSGMAAEYVQKVGKRKLLLYHGAARSKAVIELLNKELENNPDARVILFHESIDQVMRLYDILRKEGFKVVPENSKLPESLRSESIDLFRKGKAKVLVSARSLIEGFDVPAADVGIVVASSSSVRQRVQTLGRILRKHRKADGEEKHSVLHVLYMANTVDEMIYEKNDWDRVVGTERNLYYKWNPLSETLPVLQDGPPRRPLPSEAEIEWESLRPGDIYPGQYEGYEFSIDSQNNIFNEEGRLVRNSPYILEKIKQTAEQVRKFRITPEKKAILVRVNKNGEWQTIFAGIMEENLQYLTSNNDEELVEVDSLQPGNEYPGSSTDGEQYQIKQKAGRFLISKKVKRGEVYARTSGSAVSPEKGQADLVKRVDADRVLNAVKEASLKDGSKISHIIINRYNHAIYIRNGEVRFLCKINEGFEFPE